MLPQLTKSHWFVVTAVARAWRQKHYRGPGIIESNALSDLAAISSVVGGFDFDIVDASFQTHLQIGRPTRQRVLFLLKALRKSHTHSFLLFTATNRL